MAIDLWRTRPFTSPLSQMVDRMFEQAFTPFYTGSQSGNGGSTGFQSLPANIWETNDAFHAALMAPGVDEQSINVTVQDDTLAIEGELKFQTPEGAQPIWQEFGPTRFRRSLRLGSAVDPSKVEATYRNGILFVTMPKAEHAKPRQVQVQMGGAAESKKLGAG
jgi:HSP20 family molecular chaperone IbpA